MEKYTELARYIISLAKAGNLSLRQAALRSGLEASTIHKILQRDGVGVPTPETLEKLSEGLGGDYLHMMSLAGHLPQATSETEIDDPEFYAKLQRLEFLVRELAKQDIEAARRLMGMVITPFEIMLALERREEDAQVESEEVEQVEAAVVSDAVGDLEVP